MTPTDRKHNNNVYFVLSLLAETSILVVGSTAAATLTILGPTITKKARISLAQAERALRYARQQRWIEARSFDENLQLSLSRSGRQKWQKICLEQPLSSIKWDKRWRVVMFDIPAKRRGARDGFRSTLRSLGFVQFQRSVWITPHPCSQQIQLACELYRAAKYVRLIETESLQDEADWRQRFHLV